MLKQFFYQIKKKIITIKIKIKHLESKDNKRDPKIKFQGSESLDQVFKYLTIMISYEQLH